MVVRAKGQGARYPACMSRHFVRCIIAGTVALLPIGGTVLTVAYAESMLSQTWREAGYYYFPGMGLLLSVVLLYGVGLFVTTFFGRWIWRRADLLLQQLPVLGGLYQTLKQILGYGTGEDALFQEVALVPSDDTGGVQVGLVTNRIGDGKCCVFLPGSPNPTNGRMVIVDESRLDMLSCDVSDALKSLVSVGKGDLL